MRRTLLVCVVLALGVVVYLQRNAATAPGSRGTVGRGSSSVMTAFENRSSGVEVEGEGTVAAILPDDVEGSRHQRLLLRLDSGTTLLITHNIDVAPRVSSIRTGDTIAFRGEYVWNPKGGLVHWTHHDAAGHHPAGWLKHNGETFQ